MISLSDDELSVVLAAAKPLQRKDRDQFLRDVSVALAKYEVVGEGVVGRVVRDCQRRFFTPVSLNGVGKWDG